MDPLLVNVAELLRRPGNDKDISTVVSAEDIQLDDPRIARDAQVTVAAHLESMADGIVVTARLGVPWHDTCRRCLTDVDENVDVTVRELYQVVVTDHDAFPIVGEQIDLSEMTRAAVLLELPLAALCRADCAGFCPECGTNRNEAPCSCAPVRTDDRWSALDALREQLN